MRIESETVRDILTALEEAEPVGPMNRGYANLDTVYPSGTDHPEAIICGARPMERLEIDYPSK